MKLKLTCEKGNLKIPFFYCKNKTLINFFLTNKDLCEIKYFTGIFC